ITIGTGGCSQIVFLGRDLSDQFYSLPPEVHSLPGAYLYSVSILRPTQPTFNVCQTASNVADRLNHALLKIVRPNAAIYPPSSGTYGTCNEHRTSDIFQDFLPEGMVIKVDGEAYKNKAKNYTADADKKAGMPEEPPARVQGA